ncbi:MAG TPA: GYD domain-containing protein [Roseiarcus sp.]|nr:GYD domain-containing protein [Roseiarcus sp.]
MPTYVVLSNFTEQGVSKIKDTIKRSEDFKKAAKEAGVTVKELVWTLGQYDLVSVIEAQDETAVAALGLNVAKLGNIRSQTLRAFTAAEMKKILEKVA